jgi:hypothetical protein
LLDPDGLLKQKTRQAKDAMGQRKRFTSRRARTGAVEGVRGESPQKRANLVMRAGILRFAGVPAQRSDPIAAR